MRTPREPDAMPEEEEGDTAALAPAGGAGISDDPWRCDCRNGACAAMDRGAAGSRRVVMGFGPGAAPLACRSGQAPCARPHPVSLDRRCAPIESGRDSRRLRVRCRGVVGVDGVSLSLECLRLYGRREFDARRRSVFRTCGVAEIKTFFDARLALGVRKTWWLPKNQRTS
jgi:hypothetical protein